VVQVVLGVATMQSKGMEPGPLKFHMFYGFVAMIFIALMYSYREQIKKRLYLSYGLFGLFLMGLGIRAMLKV
jgi:hypothetical protein